MAIDDELYNVNVKLLIDKLEQLVTHGADQSQQEAAERHAASLSERQVLFEQLLSQQQQLFAQAIQAQGKLNSVDFRAAEDGQSVSVKEMDPDAGEAAEAAIIARISAIEEALAGLGAK